MKLFGIHGKVNEILSKSKPAFQAVVRLTGEGLNSECLEFLYQARIVSIIVHASVVGIRLDLIMTKPA